MERVHNWTQKQTCPICGKGFFPAPFHVYKDARDKQADYKKRLVCSYHCAEESKRIAGGRVEKSGSGNYSREYMKRWTPEEDALIAEMRAGGKSYREIGAVLGCSGEIVRKHCAVKKYRDKQKAERGGAV